MLYFLQEVVKCGFVQHAVVFPV